MFLVLNGLYNEPLYRLDQCSLYLKKFNRVFLTILLLGLTQSRMFQCIWNFQLFQLRLVVCRLLFILSSFSCALLLRFFFLSYSGFLLIIFMYHKPSISVNSNRGFLSWLSGLYLIFVIFLNNSIIESWYIINLYL